MASFQVTLHRVRKDSGQGEMVSCETSLLNSVDWNLNHTPGMADGGGIRMYISDGEVWTEG